MNWIDLHTQSHNWLFVIFVIILLLFAFIKRHYAYQTKEFLQLIFNDRYIVIYGKKEKVRLFFTMLFFLIQWLTLSISVYIFFYIFGLSTDFFPLPIPFEFVIFFLILIFLLLKMLVQYLIIYIFDISNFGKMFFFNRLTYSNYASFLLFILNMITIYGVSFNRYFFYISLIIFLYILVFGLFSFIKLYKKSIKPYLFYFILYLCTFEIAPYIFIGYLIKY
ncbi:DUF4271 domain-containing protein [Capnocytophaga catalasegens]|uniref:DUF4271 domain-containing protein n=1 Tax=Capnocytophaga catalasegens TaxID=1004260 RepID=UPI0035A2528C